MSKPHLLTIALLLLPLLFATCGKEDDEMPVKDYEIPETYDFQNVNYNGQLQRLAMLQEMKNYMKTAETSGVSLDANRLKAMYANDATGAGWQGSYDASKQLKGKTFEIEQPVFEAIIEALANASTSDNPGSAGQAGIVESLDGSKQYLLGPEGLDYIQIIEKGLMGACFYYQATSVYLGDERMNVDNQIVEPGEGTAMEHHWDEAFGYFGVPKGFPITTDGVVFWGDYSVKRNAQLNCNKIAMEALLKGRAAISNDDLTARDEARSEVREIWELIAVGSALHYLNESMDNFDDMAIRAHALSEGIGFVYALKFNQEKSITNDQIDELLNLMGSAPTFLDMNLYNADPNRLLQARDQLAAYYGLEDLKEDF